MLVSELIARLTELMYQNGDLPVKHSNSELGQFEDIFVAVERRDHFNLNRSDDDFLYITL